MENVCGRAAIHIHSGRAIVVPASGWYAPLMPDRLVAPMGSPPLCGLEFTVS